MLFNRDKRCRIGGFYTCRVKKYEWSRRKYGESPEVRLDRQLRNLSRVRVHY